MIISTNRTTRIKITPDIDYSVTVASLPGGGQLVFAQGTTLLTVNADGVYTFTSDDSTKTLRITSTNIAVSVDVTISALDNASAGGSVSVVSSVLPSGAATSGNQTTANTKLDTIASNQATQATAANQTTANTKLDTIASNQATQATAANQATTNTKLDTIASNQATQATAANQATTNTKLDTIAALQAPVLTTVNGNITTQNLVPAGAATAGSAVELTCANLASATVQVVGTYTGALSMQATVDGVNWITVSFSTFILVSSGAISTTITSASQSIYKIDVSGFVKIRITALAAVTGTAAVTINGVSGGVGIPQFNLTQVGANTASTNKGASGTGALRVAVAATAHSAASTENPVIAGGVVTSTLDTTLVQGDVAQHAMTTAGQLITRANSSHENSWSYAAAASGISNTTTAVTIKTAGAASIRNFVTTLDLQWEALGAATEFVIRDGAAGTVIYRTKLGTAAGSKQIVFSDALKGTAATLLEIATLTASVTGAVYANLTGHQSF